MCGFIGAFGPSALLYKKGIINGLKKINYRGPDASGFYVSSDKQSVMGHVRLSIVDLSDLANQPMKNKYSSLVYNGEIYNHMSLRKTFKVNNCSFKTSSDTETLINGLEEHNYKFLDYARGMFAGAFYNEKRKQLVIFRDTQGIKPLYYKMTNDGTLLYCSEINGLLNIRPETPHIVRKESLNFYLSFENFPQDMSLIQDINLLNPGEVRVLSKNFNSVKTHKIKKITKKILLPKNYDNLLFKTREVIENSVKEHLLSDVPIGIYLSGGIDSALVSCIAAKYNKNLTAFTGYFEDNDNYYDERKYTRLVASHINVDLNEILIKPIDFENHFDNLIKHLGQPRMGMGSFSQYIVAMHASKKRKVMLSGHGGDELFAGYPNFKAAFITENLLKRNLLLGSLSRLKLREWPWLINMIMQKVHNKKIYFPPILINKTNEIKETEKLKSFYSSNTNILENLDIYYKNDYLPGLLLVEDTISMAHSLETRVPLLDKNVVNLANKINIKNKLINGELKGFLKNVAIKYVPKEILEAPKRGFPTPLKNWFRDELKEFVEIRLSRDSDILDLVMNKKSRMRLFRNHCNLKLPFTLDELRAHKIWMLLCLSSWSKTYNLKTKELHKSTNN